MTNVFEVANYILRLGSIDEEECDLISNLKLQKLVYYCQGFFLALKDTPLFREPIEKWTHGPVCPDLYQSYKKYGSNPIPVDMECNFSNLTIEYKDIISDVYSVYGQYSAWRLREMTHEEPPWKETKDSNVISHELLATYFKTQLVN